MEWFQIVSLSSIVAILCGGFVVFWLERMQPVYGTFVYKAAIPIGVIAVVVFLGGFGGIVVSAIGFIASW